MYKFFIFLLICSGSLFAQGSISQDDTLTQSVTSFIYRIDFEQKGSTRLSGSVFVSGKATKLAGTNRTLTYSWAMINQQDDTLNTHILGTDTADTVFEFPLPKNAWWGGPTKGGLLTVSGASLAAPDQIRIEPVIDYK